MADQITSTDRALLENNAHVLLDDIELYAGIELTADERTADIHEIIRYFESTNSGVVTNGLITTIGEKIRDDIAIGDNLIASDPSLFYRATSADFVNTLYHEILGRPADPEGLAFWTSQIEDGASRISVLHSFIVSPENLGISYL